MGNCLKGPAGGMWVDDDEWEPAEYERPRGYEAKEGGAWEAAGGKTVGLKGTGGGAATEVKIKITKKQLEELLRQVDAQGLPLQELLAHLMSAGEACVQDRGRTWRPVLQSIPEGSEQGCRDGDHYDSGA